MAVTRRRTDDSGGSAAAAGGHGKITASSIPDPPATLLRRCGAFCCADYRASCLQANTRQTRAFPRFSYLWLKLGWPALLRSV